VQGVCAGFRGWNLGFRFLCAGFRGQRLGGAPALHGIKGKGYGIRVQGLCVGVGGEGLTVPLVMHRGGEAPSVIPWSDSKGSNESGNV
jgi:hypothetical protein